VKPYRVLEALLVCVLLPIGAAYLHWTSDFPLMPTKICLLVVALLLLWRDPQFDRRNLFRPEAVAAGWKRILGRFLILAAILGLIFAIRRPAPPFQFPRQHPGAWFSFVIFAPVVPAYPEEFLFRAFFFHRYGPLLPRPWMRIAASAAVFSLAHLYLANLWAVTLAFVGGLLFAETYERSRSAALASLEHGIWAAYLFTIGLGPFFYPGLR